MLDSEDGTPTGGVTPPAEARDWDAFARLYDQHEGRLYRFARLLLPGQAALAEDAVADTFIKVYRAWVDGRVDNFFGYARQALVNHVLGMFRRQQTSERYLAGVRARPEPGERPLDDAVVDAQAVFDALATLPDRRRTAVVLRYYEDLPNDEIAEIMGISVGAVKAHVFAGLGQLRERLTGGSP
jgi:RNA polymerase sigma factor (sigma-70 family)